MKKILPLIFVLVAGFGGIFGLSSHLETVKPQPDAAGAEDDLYFSGAALAAAGHDFRGLLADWYWVNSLQYLGGKLVANRQTLNINNLKPLDPRLLYPMLDAATTLDPQFITVYDYGATVLPAIDNALAVKLMEKGIASNPNEWRLYNNLGYIYWQMKDYPKASAIYGTGAEKVGAPVWMKQMSAKMLTEGASRDFARDIYRQMFETAADEQTKTFAELRYMQVQSLDELDLINVAVNDFKRQNSRCPSALRDLLPLIGKKKLPDGGFLKVNNSGDLIDPSGIPYLLNEISCAAQIDRGISKIPAN